MLDYVAVSNAGESGLRQGDTLEVGESRDLNEKLRAEGKRTVDFEPFSFYLSAWEEDRHTIAQANIDLDDNGRMTEDLVNARRQGNFVLVPQAEVDYISTFRPSSSSPWLHRLCPSWSTMMRTAR